ncbi:MAG: DUF4136 domain-containing protein, partial [Gemmatimonadetes bacterium]|nr:DUF4136 domain-containing protein [Gemmatimonadota bacterium]
TGELIWRGWAVSDIHRTSSPAQEQKQIVEAVEEILKRFPPHQEKRE